MECVTAHPSHSLLCLRARSGPTVSLEPGVCINSWAQCAVRNFKGTPEHLGCVSVSGPSLVAPLKHPALPSEATKFVWGPDSEGATNPHPNPVTRRHRLGPNQWRWAKDVPRKPNSSQAVPGRGIALSTLEMLVEGAEAGKPCKTC